MMRIATITLLSALVAGPAFAAPVAIDFTAPGFGPTSGSTAVFTKADVVGDLDITFRALDVAENPAGLLYWDSNDGGGYRDGFGIIGGGIPGSYEDDEIEGDERFRLDFSAPVHLLGYDVTDLFTETRVNGASCPAAPSCYIEWGAVRFFYADGSRSLYQTFFASPSSLLGSTNGLLSVAVDQHDVVGLLFAAAGRVDAPFETLIDFSVGGIRIDDGTSTPVPEPTSILLMVSGLAAVGVIRSRRRDAREA